MKQALRISFFISLATTAVDIGIAYFFFPSFPATGTFFLIHFLGILITSMVILELLVFKKIKDVSSKLKIQTQSDALSHQSDSITFLEEKIERWISERKGESEHLEKLESYRKDLLGNVSHELKTPIFNIQGYISTLLTGGLEDNTINRNYLERAEKSVERMIAIVEDLQAITQLEKGELEIDEEPFDIVVLCKDVLDSLERKANEKKITLDLKNNLTVTVTVMGDRFRIRQVLVNLINNSIVYGKENGTTTVSVTDMGRKAQIEVSDTGIGIAQKHLPRIFERFYRADKSRSRELGGTGLGLAIVKHIIEAHNQTIEVMSTEGVGSVFSFTLRKV